LHGLGNRNGPRQGKQQVDVISGAPNCQGWNSILPGDAADIAVKPFLNVFPDHRAAFCGREHHMNQTTCVTVRHGFQLASRLVFPFEFTQDWRPGTFSAVPTGLVFFHNLSRTTSWATLSRPYGTVQFIWELSFSGSDNEGRAVSWNRDVIFWNWRRPYRSGRK
jgi:hypothetical protein